MKFSKDIKEEDHGEHHYEAMAKKHPRFSRTFRKMARDEEGHEEKLERMAKKKALKKRCK